MSASAYLSGFLADIFISYCHVDNHQVDAKGTLWVESFHRELQGLVNTCLGHPVQIWRDPRLVGTEVFSDEIAARLRRTGVLVAIVSPGYVDSEWCTREREIFVDSAVGTGGLDVENRRRIIRAIKIPVPLGDTPEVLRPTLGFPLYSVDEQNGEPIDYLFDPRPEAEKLYRRTLSHMAQAIADLVRLMSRASSAALPTQTSRTIVYLAETTSDLESERNAIRLELEARGCVVVPRQSLPHDDVDGCVAMARADLVRSNLSLHLLGKRYGIIPEGGRRSLVELQTELAGEVTTAAFKRVLWIPRGLQPSEEQQRAFVERIRTQATRLTGSELLESSVEGLKTFLIDLLERLAKPAGNAGIKTPAPEQVDIPHIYLVRDKEDRENVAPLTKYLFNQGFEVITQADEGGEAELRLNHQENLKSCDAVMIWWGNPKKVWLDYMMRDLDRARGLGRTSPFRATAVCIAGPQAPDKDDFMTHKAQVLRFVEGFAVETLAPLVQSLKSGIYA